MFPPLKVAVLDSLQPHLCSIKTKKCCHSITMNWEGVFKTMIKISAITGILAPFVLTIIASIHFPELVSVLPAATVSYHRYLPIF